MDNQELKDFIGLSMGQLTQEISRLAANVERQSLTIREIDIKTTTRIAELQKDVEEIREDIKEVREAQRNMDESQKFKWKSLEEQRTTEKRETITKDRMQAVVNNNMSNLYKLAWVIFGIVTSIGIGFLWELIKNGGLRGMIVP